MYLQEKMVFNHYPFMLGIPPEHYTQDETAPKSTVIDEFVAPKLERTKKRIDALVEAETVRRSIREENLFCIDHDIARCYTLINYLGLKAYARGGDWLSLEQKKLQLSNEKRLEKANYWRDMLTVHKELRDTLDYYQKLIDQSKLFSWPGYSE